MLMFVRTLLLACYSISMFIFFNITPFLMITLKNVHIDHSARTWMFIDLWADPFLCFYIFFAILLFYLLLFLISSRSQLFCILLLVLFISPLIYLYYVYDNGGCSITFFDSPYFDIARKLTMAEKERIVIEVAKLLPDLNLDFNKIAIYLVNKHTAFDVFVTIIEYCSNSPEGIEFVRNQLISSNIIEAVPGINVGICKL